MLKKLFRWFSASKSAAPVTQKHIISRAEHNISRDQISPNALKVLYRLHKSGFRAYLVGGCIRDLLLGLQPKDFDIATNAHPEQVQKLFVNCRLIGRRFRLAHIHFGREIIEVATFRAHHDHSTVQADSGMILRHNAYGKIEEDVLRRDFTVNALYYNIADFSVVDFVGGVKDLNNKTLTIIGDPDLRYREDPVRMLRAIRFAAKLNFTFDPSTAHPIKNLSTLLSNIPAARLFEEYCKLFILGSGLPTFHLLCEHGLFVQLFPQTAKYFEDNKLFLLALANTDERVKQDKSIAPSFLLAVFNWQAMQELADHYLQHGKSEFLSYQEAMDKTLSEQQRRIAVPRRFVNIVRDVWEYQTRMQRRRNQRAVEQLFASQKFRVAYDFLLLRAQAGEKDAIESASWWQKYVEGDATVREKLAKGIKVHKRKRKPKTVSQ